MDRRVAVELRPATPEDAAAITAIYAPIVRDTTISFELDPPTAQEMAGRIESISTAYPFLVAEEDGDLIGYAYASQHRTRAAYQSSVDFSIYLAAAARRRGIGTMLGRAVLQAAKQRGYHAAFAGIALPNPASIALHEKLGFRHLGTYREVGRKFDAWHDVGWWQVIL